MKSAKRETKHPPASLLLKPIINSLFNGLKRIIGIALIWVYRVVVRIQYSVGFSIKMLIESPNIIVLTFKGMLFCVNQFSSAV
jgi:hypothetical protein